jgi:predicted ATP-binding protein involved in virulence
MNNSAKVLGGGLTTSYLLHSSRDIRKEVALKRCEIYEKFSASLRKDGEQMASSINKSTLVFYWKNKSTSVDRDQTECDHSGKANENSDLLTAHDTQNVSTPNQDRMKQIELEKTVNQAGEGQIKQIDMAAHKACFLSKLPRYSQVRTYYCRGSISRPCILGIFLAILSSILIR